LCVDEPFLKWTLWQFISKRLINSNNLLSNRHLSTGWLQSTQEFGPSLVLIFTVMYKWHVNFYIFQVGQIKYFHYKYTDFYFISRRRCGLDAFAKLRKTLLARVVSPFVRPFVCTETTLLPFYGILSNFTFDYYSKICWKMSVLIAI
jgi:hypothetical protein